MKKLMFFVALACVSSAFIIYVNAQEAKQKPALWSAISVSSPLIHEYSSNDWGLYFSLVNDADKVINPQIGSSHLYINGKEPEDWNFVINNGLRSSYDKGLPPGKFILFNYSLKQRYFSKPGIYRVLWQGADFKTEEVVVRVMPKGS